MDVCMDGGSVFLVCGEVQARTVRSKWDFLHLTRFDVVFNCHIAFELNVPSASPSAATSPSASATGCSPSTSVACFASSSDMVVVL